MISFLLKFPDPISKKFTSLRNEIHNIKGGPSLRKAPSGTGCSDLTTKDFTE
jgi:hypothetical protein